MTVQLDSSRWKPIFASLLVTNARNPVVTRPTISASAGDFPLATTYPRRGGACEAGALPWYEGGFVVRPLSVVHRPGFSFTYTSGQADRGRLLAAVDGEDDGAASLLQAHRLPSLPAVLDPGVSSVLVTADMTAASPAAPTEERRFHWHRLITGAVVILVVGAIAYLLGWDIRGWFSDLWDTMNDISVGYLIAAVVLKTVQTTLTAFGWYSILRFAYGDGVRWLHILACYAASVAMNSILPANLGTFALLLMFTTIIAGATFAGVLGGYAVQKIFYTLIGLFVYLYLFLNVAGSFDIKFAFVHEHPWATAIVILGGGYLIFVVLRRLWPRVVKWWDQAKEGGAILARPRTYLARVFLPSFLSWLASLAVMGVFLAAYSIPVTFDTLMRICGGNSIANVTSVTPGGAGVTQAFNVASLNGVASATDATAYSVAQQLVTTCWNIILAIVLMAWAFGWSGGKSLVSTSYAGAKEKAAEQQAARKERKEAKRSLRERTES